jgi:hypothetical protein
MLACLDWLDFPLPQPRSIAPAAGRWSERFDRKSGGPHLAPSLNLNQVASRCWMQR